MCIIRYHATERARLRQDNSTNNTTNNNTIYCNIRVPALSYHDESADEHSHIQQYSSTDTTNTTNSATTSTVPTTAEPMPTDLYNTNNSNITNNTSSNSNSGQRVYTTHIYPTQIYPYIDDIHNYTHNTTAYKKRRIYNTTTNIYDATTHNTHTHTDNNDNSILINEQYDTIQACYNLQALKSSHSFQA